MFTRLLKGGIRLILISASIFICANDIRADGRLCLIPRPKNIDVKPEAIFLKFPYRVIASPGDESGFVQWLKDDLLQTFNWRSTNEQAKAALVIEFKYQDLKHGNEAYKIEILPGMIEITIASPDAGYRAVGRLLSILESNCTKINPDGNLICPELKIFDWPDMSMRGMHLQMAYAGWQSNAVQIEIIRRTIDTMARLGFNFVVFEIGGRFESLKSPEVTVNGQWSQAQLRELVKYAKSHGITPYPGINSIGHLDRSPQIFVLKNDKGMRVAMDIMHPEFYAKFFGILDELSEIFDQPAYFHIGTDESAAAFEKLIAVSGKSGSQIYADFINKTTLYLEQKNIRPVIWHDMLISQDQVNSAEPANGKKTSEALDIINKKIVIDYWCYASLDKYIGLNHLAQNDFEIWISPWQFPAGIKSLIGQVKKNKINAMLGTTWDLPYNVGPAFVLSADYAWNALIPDFNADYDASSVFANYFHRRKTKMYVSNSQSLVFTGGIQESCNNQNIGNILEISGIKLPLNKIIRANKFNYDSLTNIRDAKKLMSQNRKSMILVMDPKNDSIGARIDDVDTPRLNGSTILYTPDFGKKTNTNNYGDEFILNKDKVEKNTVNQGSNTIPLTGGVISTHGSGNDTQRWLTGRLATGSDVRLVVVGTNLEKNTELTTRLPENINGIILLVTARITAFGNPVQLGKVVLEYDNGKSDTVNINNDFLVRNTPTSGQLSYWSVWQDIGSTENKLIAAYEWNKSASSYRPQTIKIIITPEGALLGLGLLSGMYW